MAMRALVNTLRCTSTTHKAITRSARCCCPRRLLHHTQHQQPPPPHSAPAPRRRSTDSPRTIHVPCGRAAIAAAPLTTTATPVVVLNLAAHPTAATAPTNAAAAASQRAFASAARSTAAASKTSGSKKATTIIDFPGASTPVTTTMDFHAPVAHGQVMHCYRVMDELSQLVDPAYNIDIDNDKLVQMYKTLVRLHQMDLVFYDSQSQGRISFYMTHFCEEATHVASAAALHDDDIMFGQYREAGALMWRGFTLQNFANQCFSNAHDLGKGRQMPVHYGSRKLNYHTISSPLATQIPQAAGAAYALQQEGADKVAIVYFGEGAASEGDTHAAMNFASTLDCPVIFFCRNNGYAISTVTGEQYRGDGIAARGVGYGIPSIRVDGNDMLAVHDVVSRAREMALKDKTPVLIEAMTYRGGHHSTSDDSTRYRSVDEITEWVEVKGPLVRSRLLLERLGLWDSDMEAAEVQSARSQMREALAAAEKMPKPSVSSMFKDVYDDVPKPLLEQEQALHAHLAAYRERYSISEYDEDGPGGVTGDMPEMR